MKYLSLFFLTNILAITVTFSSADDPKAGTRKTDVPAANYMIKPDVDSNSDYVTMTFIDAYKKVDEVEEGRIIDFYIMVGSSLGYFKDGRLKNCSMIDTANRDNMNVIFDECISRKGPLIKWFWSKDLQMFLSILEVTKMSGSQSHEFKIECHAIVCHESCPELICPGR